MPKIDYELVETQLVTGMRQWTAERLRDLTARSYEREASARAAVHSPPDRLAFLKQLKRDLDLIYVRNKHIYRELGFPARHLKFAFAAYKALPEAQWAKVEQLRTRLDAYMKEHPFVNDKGEPESKDETWVETQRIAHQNRRHNVRKDWLPS